MKTLVFLLLICISSTLKAEIVKFPFHSKALENSLIGTKSTRDIHIYLPDGYHDSDKRYPVLYMLGAYSWPIKYSERIEPMLENHKKNGHSMEMIIVMLEGNTPLRGSFYVNSQVHGNFSDYVIKEVLPWVDRTYRTKAQPEHRGITGFSMGGTGALRFAAKHPDLFGHVYALSPGMFDEKGMAKSYLTSKEAIKRYQAFKQKLAEAKDPKAVMDAEFASFQGREIWNNGQANSYSAYLMAYAGAFAGQPDQPFGVHYSVEPAQKPLWYRGFGELVDLYSTPSVVEQLSSVRIDVGDKDDYIWITEGVLALKQKAEVNKVPIYFEVFPGGHSDKALERLEHHMLPFFNERL
ncbi:alpha/beta hydrolase [Pseudoalteromonas luteoviolacea]|uniref:Esterase n=1 Tax=Pseudoalteromonas luteoviolacea S4054 TaxID=1129367 RepID=A0A0F6A980_9GAMM|nr:alpha/beta hydrolase [Pseudoalteromonas luteoviolacea]AOT06933.1 hypothetical protein S4054249_03150 [Pseudoalteromonas luteoviolacea]AOT11851.1 hypothetical protein S40542_03150 [Pseudoalteromonas luteoviolacea]AOT16763.1 hypothetical protein S4054_03150 [Pseudoalteromonas luteoviolacea]KKE82735.1 hypothetical protein N479_16910 [Pseudoalteromonas luteoviolacea S4054]KZN72946.1 hypothetical protein N481_13915 [Pseudoalteromonas luteoviolacea S4047-1]